MLTEMRAGPEVKPRRGQDSQVPMRYGSSLLSRCPRVLSQSVRTGAQPRTANGVANLAVFFGSDKTMRQPWSANQSANARSPRVVVGNRPARAHFAIAIARFFDSTQLRRRVSNSPDQSWSIAQIL
jgi:hypothetical protein